jgi:molybdenum cofactor cytidylyltransferase
MIAAIIPSSGKSERMGQPKGLLKLKGKTLLSWQIESLFQAQIIQVIVVGPIFLKQHVLPKARFVDSEGKAAEMIDSVRLGLKNISNKTKGILIVPSDFPILDQEIIDFMILHFQKDKSKIIVPVFNGKGGHPVIIPERFFNEIMESFNGEGIRGLKKKYPENVKKVEYKNSNIHLNINTPEDFEKYQQKIKK